MLVGLLLPSAPAQAQWVFVARKALWFSQPAKTRSTPLAAIAGAVCGMMRPEASAMVAQVKVQNTG